MLFRADWVLGLKGMGWKGAPGSPNWAEAPHGRTDSESGLVDDHSVPLHLTFRTDEGAKR